MIGFNRRKTHHVVPVEECPIASPGLIDRLDVLHAIARAAGADAFRITVTETLTGLDIPWMACVAALASAHAAL